MSDCVDREAVINAINRILNPCTDMAECITLSHLKEDIERLPAVEPERPKGHWIPLTWEDEYKIVSDFPDDMDGTWVIVTDGKSISVERIKKDAYDHFFPAGRWFELDEVKAWMPLPEPYCGADMRENNIQFSTFPSTGHNVEDRFRDIVTGNAPDAWKFNVNAHGGVHLVVNDRKEDGDTE